MSRPYNIEDIALDVRNEARRLGIESRDLFETARVAANLGDLAAVTLLERRSRAFFDVADYLDCLAEADNDARP